MTFSFDAVNGFSGALLLLDTIMENSLDQENYTDLQFTILCNTNSGNEERPCSACKKNINHECSLSWELMDFCDSKCLSKYQKYFPSTCSNCSANIDKAAFGKYYLRLKNCFASFCSKNCLRSYRLSFSICSFCESVEPVKNAADWLTMRLKISSTLDDFSFCSISCYRRFLDLIEAEKSWKTHKKRCRVCEKTEPLEIVLNYKGIERYFCGKKCLISNLNLSNNEECSVCRKYYSLRVLEENRGFHKNSKMYFCTRTCRNIFSLLNRKDMRCDWCQVNCHYISMVKKATQEFSPKVQFCSASCFEKHKYSTATLQKCSVKLSQLVFDEDEFQEDLSSDPSNRIQRTTQRGNKLMDLSKNTVNKQVQTKLSSAIFLPIPVPIYVPVPMAMYSIPIPYPLPFPLPIPVPIFLPVSRKTMKGVTKEIAKYKNKFFIDPCQAEILQMADALIENEKPFFSDSESETNVDVEEIQETEIMKNEVENNFDFEWALSDALTDVKIIAEDNREKLQDKKRKLSIESDLEGKKLKYEDNICETNGIDCSKDENYMRLDYTLGINAWKQWVSKHNTMQPLTFTSEILKVSPEEFSVALCYFVQELRKPNGDEYAPDTIYYLCLGIQYYLDQNGRFDNIFNDLIYDKFTDCLDALAIQFCALYDDESHFIVTRVEEEHLWETKQLGCYSPHVLLNTLIYFNTKYYCRSNVDEHLQLSFYHILRGGKTLKSAMLRYYPSSKNSRRKKVYEMFENNEDPLRCPVRLYEYYLSKCPEGVKNKYDTMYLLPEKHCTSESPVWYSSESLPRRYLAKIVNRVKMVKEINVALLSFDN